MKIDILIPLGSSNIGHIDLRYALRSIERHVKNYRDIWIIGDLPQWIKGVKNIPHSDDPLPEWKEKNIYNKIMAGCLSPNVTDSFLFTNDDIYLLEDVDATQYPYYYKGTCYESMVANKNHYRKTMYHTKSLLERRGFKDINADAHCPIIYNKKEFLTTFEPEHWDTKWGYGIKSLYCAFNRKDMVYLNDCKIKKKLTLEQVRRVAEGRHVISCTDAPLKAGLLEFLQERFPTKSKYEND